MNYRYYNPNPSGKLVGDCVIRALSKALDRSWEEIYVKVALQGLMMHDMPSSNSVWGSFLYAQNFKRYAIPNTCPDCYTVAEFAYDNQEGTFILSTGSHVVCVQDGCYFDAWDSGTEIPAYYWTREEITYELQ